MSPKKAILRTLFDRHSEEGQERLVRPPSIPGFDQTPEKFQKTINDLLKDRLIEGVRDGDGHMALSLNPHRIQDARRALRPVWAHPGFLALAAVLALVAALGLAG
jgi:hypothetical protein